MTAAAALVFLALVIEYNVVMNLHFVPLDLVQALWLLHTSRKDVSASAAGPLDRLWVCSVQIRLVKPLSV